MISPTTRQRDLLRYIHGYVREHGEAPTVREMVAAMGISSHCSLHKMLSALVERGHLRRHPTRARGLDVLVHLGTETRRFVSVVVA